MRVQEREARVKENEARLLEHEARLQAHQAPLKEQQASLKIRAGLLEEQEKRLEVWERELTARERKLSAREVKIGDETQLLQDGERRLRENHEMVVAAAGALAVKLSNFHEKAARLGLDVDADDDFKLVLAAPQLGVEERRWVACDGKRHCVYPPQSRFQRGRHCCNPFRAADGLRGHAVKDSVPSCITAPAGWTAE